MSNRKFLVLLRSTPGQGKAPSPEEMQAMYGSFKSWMETFRAEILDLGAKLKPDGRVLTPAGVADGPFVEAKEVVGGFMILSAPSYERAAEVAAACPGTQSPGTSIEIREMVSG